MKLLLDLTSRRTAFSAMFATLATSCLTVVSRKKEVRRQRVEWVHLTDQTLGPGDFWAAENPNRSHLQGGKVDDGPGYFSDDNPLMRAVHRETWGKRPCDNDPHVNLGNGAYWRPVRLVDI